MNEWQPIETKPRGEVLLYYPPLPPLRGSDRVQPAWIVIGHGNTPRQPTHWMPLPPPPKPTEKVSA